MVLEELAIITIAVAFPVFEASFGPSLAIADFALEERRQRILPAVCSGDMVVAVSMSDPQAGTALTDLKTTARLAGDKIILNGNKRWCSGAGHADAYVVYCPCRMPPVPTASVPFLWKKTPPALALGRLSHIWDGAAFPVQTCILMGLSCLPII